MTPPITIRRIRFPEPQLLVQAAARPDFSQIETMARGPERKTAAYDAIVATAKESQAPLVALADQLKADGAITGYEQLHSPNMLVVDPAPGKSYTVAGAFQAAEGVKAIYSDVDGSPIKVGRSQAHGGVRVLNPGFVHPGFTHQAESPVPLPEPSRTPVPTTSAPTSMPYGLQLIGAPAAWERGADGHGLVYGSIDTGVDAQHPALKDDYRGTTTGSHDYNWFDPTGKTTAPRDTSDHGTHTIGTITGEGVGVAPDAKFIAASFSGSDGVDTVLKSMQWMLAPTKLDGSDPRPDLAPDVVGMSIGLASAGEDLFRASVQDMRAAGIVPVKSAGNAGPRPNSITTPGQYAEVVTTAAVGETGEIAPFSSRGPDTSRTGAVPKPDFAAPGVQTISTVPGDKFGIKSGTSMAQPHMSGAILDILSKYPQLTDDQLDQVLRAGAEDRGPAGHDPAYGHGIINIPASLDAAEALLASPSAR